MPTSAQESISATFAHVEQTGMKLAIKGHIVAIVLMGIWLIASRPADRAGEFITVLSVLALIGLLHYAAIGSGVDRPWVKCVFITIDIAIFCLAVILSDAFPSADLPQVVIFRFDVFQYYFIILAVAAFSCSPGMLIWSGFVGAAGLCVAQPQHSQSAELDRFAGQSDASADLRVLFQSGLRANWQPLPRSVDIHRRRSSDRYRHSPGA